MRATLIFGLSAALLVGCKHAKPSDSTATAAPAPANKGSTQMAAKSTPAKQAKSQPAAAVAIHEPTGKVASLNSNLRFVVIDFGLNPVPQADQRLNVYRQGQKVGEVKISNQARNSIIAADVTAGDVQVGDEVRP